MVNRLLTIYSSLLLTVLSYSLLDKMYSISSAEALTLFYKNPRAYILPPNPRIPCKICVVGPPTSGKSTLAKALAEHYNAVVIHVHTYIYHYSCHCRYTFKFRSPGHMLWTMYMNVHVPHVHVHVHVY